jgi:hypothetical protein
MVGFFSVVSGITTAPKPSYRPVQFLGSISVIDGAGWHHSGDLLLPGGIHLGFLLAYLPELQPADRLWQLADEPLVNQAFDSLDALEDQLAKRCCTLMMMQAEIKALTNFHWWPP